MPKNQPSLGFHPIHQKGTVPIKFLICVRIMYSTSTLLYIFLRILKNPLNDSSAEHQFHRIKKSQLIFKSSNLVLRIHDHLMSSTTPRMCWNGQS